MIKNLFRISGPRKKYLIRGAVLLCIESIFTAAPFGFLCITILDLFSGSLNTQKVILMTLGILICLVIKYLLSYYNHTTYAPHGYITIKELRLQIGDHLRKLSMGFFSEKNAGHLNATINQDIKNIEAVPTHIWQKMVAAVALPVFISVMLFFIDWRMALAALVGLPLAIPVFILTQKFFRKSLRTRQAAQGEFVKSIIEYIQGMSVIKAFNQVGERFEKFDESLRNFKKANLKAELGAYPYLLIYVIVLELGFVAVLLIGPYLFFGGQITMATLLIFLILSLRLYAPMREIAELSGMMRLADAALARVNEILDVKPLPEPAHNKKLNKFDIEFDNVSFSYEHAPVLQSVSFKIPERSITALVGPSGCGKTTITNLIARFWDVDEGEIKIGGVNIKDLKTNKLLPHISMVFQDVYLFNDTIKNNIMLGKKEADMEEIVEAAKKAQCHDFISRIPEGYDTIIGGGGSTLSGGEKQRISIARAILKEAPIILLDEATAMIDPENERLIQEAINSLVKEKTLVIIAHRLSTITSADQIIVLNNNGGIEEVGKHEELIKTGGMYTRFWKARQHARSWKVTRRKKQLKKG